MHSYQNKEPFQSFVSLSAAGEPDGLGREVELDWTGPELERGALVLFEFKPFGFELSGSEPESSGRKSPESSLVLPLSPPGVLVDRGLVEVQVGARIVEIRATVFVEHKLR